MHPQTKSWVRLWREQVIFDHIWFRRVLDLTFDLSTSNQFIFVPGLYRNCKVGEILTSDL